MDSIWFPIALTFIGLILVVLELFIPSGGMVGVLALICLVTAVVFAFFSSMVYGAILLLAIAIVVPILLSFMLKVWPHTAIGKKLFAVLPTREDVIPHGDFYKSLPLLIGKRGVAKTKMLPSGTVMIDGQRFDAVTNGSAVDAGDKIEVIAIRTNRIIVQPILVAELDEANNDDILSQSPESLGLDSWNEPLDQADSQ